MRNPRKCGETCHSSSVKHDQTFHYQYSLHNGTLTMRHSLSVTLPPSTLSLSQSNTTEIRVIQRPTLRKRCKQCAKLVVYQGCTNGIFKYFICNIYTDWIDISKNYHYFFNKYRFSFVFCYVEMIISLEARAYKNFLVSFSSRNRLTYLVSSEVIKGYKIISSKCWLISQAGAFLLHSHPISLSRLNNGKLFWFSFAMGNYCDGLSTRYNCFFTNRLPSSVFCSCFVLFLYNLDSFN